VFQSRLCRHLVVKALARWCGILLCLSCTPSHAQAVSSSTLPSPLPVLPVDSPVSAAGMGAVPTTVPITAPLKLSLNDAVALAREHNPLVQGAQARIAGANARLRTARALPNPTLSLTHAFGSTNTGGFDEDVLVTQNFELFGKRGARVRGARAELRATQADAAFTAVDLTFQVASAYYNASRADAERNLAAEALATAQRFFQSAQTQFEAGDVARRDVLRSSIERARAWEALAQSETDRTNTYATLASLTGLSPDVPLTLTDKLEGTPAAYTMAALQDVALRSRADLLSAQLTLQSRQAAVAAARAQSRPDLFVEARRAAITPYEEGVNGNSVRVGVTFTPLDFGRNRGGVREAEAAVHEQQATLGEVTRAARLEVETAFATFERARGAVESFEKGRLQAAKELLDMEQIGYERGASSFLELLDAQQVYRNEQADYARSLAALNIARVALERAVGGRLP
jgi:cobalt-zinc-cadmium efflux system outer membrane protein